MNYHEAKAVVVSAPKFRGSPLHVDKRSGQTTRIKKLDIFILALDSCFSVRFRIII